MAIMVMLDEQLAIGFYLFHGYGIGVDSPNIGFRDFHTGFGSFHL